MVIFKKLVLVILLGFFISCSKSSSDTDGDPSGISVNKRANLFDPGDSANDILSNDNFDKILIEIAYVTGFRPTTLAISQLTEYLRQHTFKENIEIVYLELPSPVEDSLTLNEIADLETKNRTAYNSGSTLAVYIYFADAPAEGDDLENGLVTLGAVYRNTSMVIHEVTVRDLASKRLTVSDEDVETATLNHEFGHLFGLVNLGTDMVNDHESQSENNDGILVADNHCNQDGCLMRSELQFNGSVSAKLYQATSTKLYEASMNMGCVLSGNSVLSLLEKHTARGSAAAIDLDPECILDISANGGR